MHYHPFVIEFWIEEKIYTKTVVDASGDDGERVFLFSWERVGED